MEKNPPLPPDAFFQLLDWQAYVFWQKYIFVKHAPADAYAVQKLRAIYPVEQDVIAPVIRLTVPGGISPNAFFQLLDWQNSIYSMQHIRCFPM